MFRAVYFPPQKSVSVVYKFSQIFRIFDVDNNGVISKPELAKLVKDMSGMMAMSGSITEDELVESSWREMDSDRDNCISLDEFVTSVLRHDKFSKLLAIRVLDLFT